MPQPPRPPRSTRAVFLGAFTLGVVVTLALGAAAPRGDGPYPKLGVFAKVLSYVENNYVEEVDDSKLIYGAVKGMLGGLDPHTAFMEPREYQSMKEDTTGEFGGLGLEITQKDEEIVVLTPVDDTPAARAGIRPGDVITAIDNVLTRGMTVLQASTYMKGAPGTQVTLRLFRPEFSQPREFVLVRDRIRIVSVEGRLLEPGLGYVRVKNFQDRTDLTLGKELAKLRDAAGPALRGLVLDLRNNPGGLLEEGVRVADRFLKRGVIVTTRGRNGRHPEEELASGRDTEPNYPIVVLVNRGTASASEVVAGALQDHGRAVLFGTTSYGKGSVQTVIDLEDGSGLKLTVARYYTPSGRSIQERGIIPDVRVEAGPEDAAGEAGLPGHILNDAPGAVTVALDAAKVIPVRAPGGEALADVQLQAALDALRQWDTFQRALTAQRSAPAPK